MSDDDYLYDKSGHDPEIAKLEDALGAYAHRAPLRRPRSKLPARRLIIGAAFAAAAAAVAIFVQLRATGGDCGGAAAGFNFAVEGGVARCAGGLADRGKLPVGAWLETPRGAVADVRVADIGAIRLYGDSRLRLVGTGPSEHRLELAEGRLSAKVTAPPRLFVVDTPAAVAVDQGCAYDLAVDAAGRTTLKVTSGAVTLVGSRRTAYVARGAEVVAARDRGPGTPVSSAAGAALRAAVARFDAGDPSAAAEIAKLAEAGDTLTLWNLLGTTEGASRAAVYGRLDALAARPADVAAADVLAGKSDALDRWREALEGTWQASEPAPMSPPTPKSPAPKTQAAGAGGGPSETPAAQPKSKGHKTRTPTKGCGRPAARMVPARCCIPSPTPAKDCARNADGLVPSRCCMRDENADDDPFYGE